MYTRLLQGGMWGTLKKWSVFQLWKLNVYYIKLEKKNTHMHTQKKGAGETAHNVVTSITPTF